MQKSESKEGRSPTKFTQISSRWVGNPGLQDVINNKKAFDYLQAALGNTYKLDTQVGTSVKLLCMALSFQLSAIIKAWPGLLWQTGQPPLVGNLLNCIIYIYNDTYNLYMYIHVKYTYTHLFIFPQANPSQNSCICMSKLPGTKERRRIQGRWSQRSSLKQCLAWSRWWPWR